jgi:hypothetical protein
LARQAESVVIPAIMPRRERREETRISPPPGWRRPRPGAIVKADSEEFRDANTDHFGLRYRHG